jgi:hypothetical protein
MELRDLISSLETHIFGQKSPRYKVTPQCTRTFGICPHFHFCEVKQTGEKAESLESSLGEFRGDMLLWSVNDLGLRTGVDDVFRQAKTVPA